MRAFDGEELVVWGIAGEDDQEQAPRGLNSIKYQWLRKQAKTAKTGCRPS